MKFLRAYLRSGLRGQTRITFLLARLIDSLEFVPVKVADCEPFYVNLRRGHHELLRGAPHASSPWEGDEQDVMRRVVREGDVVFDIGANIGLHAVLLSKLAGAGGRLCVFEPNSELLPNLAATVAGLGNATLYPVALSDKCETTTLYVPDNAEMGSLANWTSGRDDVGEIRAVDCVACCMDDLIDSGEVPRPDFIKCDVEGAELTVFSGGRKTLDRDGAPTILFEANVHNARGFGLGVDDAKNYLAGLAAPGFEFFEVQEGGRLARTDKAHPVHSNILAVPRSRSDRLSDLPIGGAARSVKAGRPVKAS